MDYLVDLLPFTILQGDPTHSKRLPPAIANQGMQSEVLTEDIIEHSTLEHLGSLEGGGRGRDGRGRERRERQGGMGGEGRGREGWEGEGEEGGRGRGGRKGGEETQAIILRMLGNATYMYTFAVELALIS